MLKIRDCMKKMVYSVPSTATVREAIDILLTRHIGLLPVLDEDRKPVGVVGLKDVVNLALPTVVHLLDDVDFVVDFGAVENFTPSTEILSQPITSIMRPGKVVKDDSGLLRTYALMLQHDLHDMPVVDQEGRLIGIASRVDIGTTILSSWR